MNVASTFARHLTLLRAEPTELVAGPFESTNSGVHTVHTRTSMFVLFELVLVIIGGDYTVSDVFQLVYPFLEAEGILVVCSQFPMFCSWHQYSHKSTIRA
jgi:hypothetical protein